MSHLAKDMTPDVTWKDITPGCNIYEGGTSSVVETGDWQAGGLRLLLLQGLRHLRQHLPLRGHHYGQGREIRRGRNNGNQRKTFRQ